MFWGFFWLRASVFADTDKVAGIAVRVLSAAPPPVPLAPRSPRPLVVTEGESGAVGGCRWPLHRWLQVQRHAWLITKGLQSSGRHSSPFLPKAGGGGGGGREQGRRTTVVVKRVNRRGNELLYAWLFFSVHSPSPLFTFIIYIFFFLFCILLLQNCIFNLSSYCSYQFSIP